MTITPELWQKKKQKEVTYRYDYKSWKGVQPPSNSWLVRGSRGGAFSPKGLLWIEVCRRVLGTETRKSEAYKIYVPLPCNKVVRLNSMKGLWDLCYAVGTRACSWTTGTWAATLSGSGTSSLRLRSRTLRRR
jgi:hypothetical protein